MIRSVRRHALIAIAVCVLQAVSVGLAAAVVAAVVNNNRCFLL
jgi:hypothetical protein